MKRVLIGLFLLAGGCTAESPPVDPQPITIAHSHNDYAHGRPLKDALECGICSVEADVVLKKGELLVAHKPEEVTRGRTLQSLYLEPLRKRVATHGGRVFRGGPTVTLLIDFKTEAAPTYPVLRRVLRKYADMLTSYDDGQTRERAITVVLTGNRPSPALIVGEKHRVVGVDGVLDELDQSWPADLMPQMNVQWTKVFQWRGDGSMPEPERVRLRQLVERAHQRGRKIRFWEAPDQPRAWAEMLDAGVDLINTDRLFAFRDFVRNQPGLYSQNSSRLPSGSAK